MTYKGTKYAQGRQRREIFQGGYLEVVSIVLVAILDFPPNNSRYLIHVVRRKMDYLRSLRVADRGAVASGMEQLLINIKGIADGYQRCIGGACLAEIDQFSKHVLQSSIYNIQRSFMRAGQGRDPL